jgi:hypothetical protein
MGTDSFRTLTLLMAARSSEASAFVATGGLLFVLGGVAFFFGTT